MTKSCFPVTEFVLTKKDEDPVRPVLFLNTIALFGMLFISIPGPVGPVAPLEPWNPRGPWNP
jgi:hypothetical protein